MPRCAATRRASWRSSMVQQVPNAAVALIVELHRHADDVVALFGEQRRGDRRIDAARHRHDDPLAGTAHRRAGARRRSFSHQPSAAPPTTWSISASVVVLPEAEAQRVQRAMVREAHRLEDVRRLEGARRARRTGRHGDALEIERDQQRLRLDAVERDVGGVGHRGPADRRSPTCPARWSRMPCSSRSRSAATRGAASAACCRA